MARTAPAAAKTTKAAAKKAPAKKVAAKTASTKAPAKKATAAKTASAKAPAKKAAATKSAASKTVASKTVASKTAASKAAASKATAPGKTAAGRPPEGWSAKELAAVRADLEAQLLQMRADYAQTMEAIDELQSHGSDGAGDDQADAGSKTFEREHEMSLAKNRRDLIDQFEHAVERIDAGTYGQCESCGKPIAKARLQAFPAATLCVACKQREERR